MNKINWTNYFLGLAFCVAERSIDSQTKHGCIIVDDKTHNILSVGYNGPPRKCKDDSKIPTTRPAKYLWMSHAEANARDNCLFKTDNMTAYVTGQCCPTCLLSLWQFGIQKVVMADCHGSYTITQKELDWEKDFVEQTGIEVVKVKPNLDWLVDVISGRAKEFMLND